jgi:hypothetical protein
MTRPVLTSIYVLLDSKASFLGDIERCTFTASRQPTMFHLMRRTLILKAPIWWDTMRFAPDTATIHYLSSWYHGTRSDWINQPDRLTLIDYYPWKWTGAHCSDIRRTWGLPIASHVITDASISSRLAAYRWVMTWLNLRADRAANASNPSISSTLRRNTYVQKTWEELRQPQESHVISFRRVISKSVATERKAWVFYEVLTAVTLNSYCLLG